MLLAFAFLYPDFELYIFFMVPLKIKWLALLTWVGYLVMLANGDWLARLLMLASVGNFLLFFGPEVWERVQTGRRRMARQAAETRYGRRESPATTAAPCAASPTVRTRTWTSAIAASAPGHAATAWSTCTSTSTSPTSPPPGKRYG